jgi:hypothetical protein
MINPVSSNTMAIINKQFFDNFVENSEHYNETKLI